MSSFEFLGPYRIGQSLGRGGMGSVFAAVHEKTGEQVAVKLIATHVADEPRFRRRFDSEVKTLQRLRHPGIVRLIGFGEERGQLFYSMELVRGESLQKRIRREKRLDWRPTIDIAIQICAALKHAHDIGVIHRDLKPANLLLTGDDTVKLVDFGIAKIFGDGEQTLAGSVLGTADYMAPEQAASTGISARTDLYALGSVMYAMVTGRPPFTGKKITEVIESLKRDQPVPLDLVNPELPEALVELIHQLLEKDPQSRPPTALAVMNRLKAMRAGLQREQTMLADGLPTELGDLNDSSDTNVVENDLSSAATGVAQNNDPSRLGTVLSEHTPAKGVAAASDEKTVASDAGQTIQANGQAEDQEDASPKTHFQTVDETGSRESLFHDPEEPTGNRWHAVLLIAVLGIMFGCAVWFVLSTRSRTADELHLAITGAAGDGPDRMQAIEEFVRRFPDDARFQEVHNLWMDARLTRTIRRLEARIGKPLDAMEQGFLDAMKGRKEEPSEASKQLQSWLDVHDSTTRRADQHEQELIDLAKHEKQQLAKRPPAIPLDPRAEELIQKIRTSVEKAPVEETRKLLEGVLQMHSNDPWAQPAVQRAQQQLKLLDQ